MILCILLLHEAQLLGGESADAATAILTLALMENATLRSDTIMTGTINADGTIGPVGEFLKRQKQL